MITKIKNGRLVLSDRIEEKNLYIENGKITAITGDDLPFDDEFDAGGAYVAPGFIDIHVHGGGGFEFADGTEEALVNAANIHFAHGTTTLYPTISAYDYEKTAAALGVIEKYGKSDGVKPHIYGCHLEGPYFSPEQSGAQDPSFIRTPDEAEYKKLVARYASVIKRWSYAPELDGADKFLDFLNENRIVASAAHTDAELSHIKKAYEHGMKLITHLYSCTSTIKRRQGFRILGVTEAAYYFDGITVEAIADGCHLPPELLALIYKLKGAERVCLVTDAIRHGGMENAENDTCQNGNMPYIIEDGVAKLADRSAFAGSIATADCLVRTCVKKAGIPLCDAVKMITETPAKTMGLERKGKLEKGFDADVVVFDSDVNVLKVFVS